ncbi:MAG TPA: glycosyltransferase [Candidatus Dormibacteraeota bacterium]|nr:glycosyltransferase [Candidatus Dormibacteraeota bacterium]
MRVLVLTPTLPYPPVWGAAIRNHRFLKWLGSRHRVRLLTYAGPEHAAGIARLEAEGIRVRAVDDPGTGKRMAQLRSLFSPRSHLGSSLHRPAMQREIDRLLAEEGADVVLVEGSHLARFRFGDRVPVVLDEHNLEYELLERTYRTERSPLRRGFARVEYLKFRKEEQAAWRAASWVVVTSERERQLIRESGCPTPSTVVPNGVDLEYLTPSPGSEPDRLLFTGRISYRPNTDAVLHFARHVLPLIRRRRPEVVFTVVGAGAPAEVRRLAGPRLRLTGEVADVRPYWRRSAVVVAPIRFGGGTRLKIVEAMAMGRPVVSTSLGCEGLEVTPGEHLLVADSPRDFAEAVVRLLEDRGLREELGRRGRRLVEERYDWRRLSAELEGVLLRAALGRTWPPGASVVSAPPSARPEP